MKGRNPKFSDVRKALSGKRLRPDQARRLTGGLRDGYPDSDGVISTENDG